MKIYAIIVLVLTLIMVFLPLSFIAASQKNDEPQTVTATEEDSTIENSAQSVAVLLTSTDEVVELEIFDYLKGCVASEMPASYELEALKAQVVASYTYIKWLEFNCDNPNAAYLISDNSSEYQGYISEDEMLEMWGDDYDEYNEKIEEAISSVLGEYLSYEDEPILACFHAISSGITSNSEDVWLEAYPYLTSVVATGDKLSPNYEQSTTFTQEQMSERLSNLGVSTAETSADSWFGDFDVTESGFVSEITVIDESFDANELRYALDLASPNFEIEFADDEFIVTTYGYGHGVGMSQYSANYMARQGYTYDEILLHFFTGVTLESGD
ncbi:MAG: stage II sporulation protein D [Clostridia bacterium]